MWGSWTRRLAPQSRTRAGDEREVPVLLRPPEAPIRYQVMNTVPEQWIPFIPVHVEGSTRETQLQRAALPRILTGDPNPPAKVRPRTTLLRARFPSAYFIHEEQVPRSGRVIELSYQRARRSDGSVVIWLAAGKQTGRGEGSSGLRFDALVNTEPAGANAPRDVGHDATN